MTAETYAMLLEWLASEEELHRRHAVQRLAMPDAQEIDPAIVIPPIEPDHIRAARLIAEHPPDPTDRRCCNG